MALVRFTPRRLTDPIAQFERVLDSVVPAFAAPNRRAAWTPRVDVRETDIALEVSVELPGVAEADVELTVRENILTIEGDKPAAVRADEGDDGDDSASDAVYYSERHYGKFRRRLALPSHVNADEATAEFADGVLTVHLPKADSHRSRQISISSE